MLEDGASWEQLQNLLTYLLKEYGVSAELEAIDETVEDEGDNPK